MIYVHIMAEELWPKSYNNYIHNVGDGYNFWELAKYQTLIINNNINIIGVVMPRRCPKCGMSYVSEYSICPKCNPKLYLAVNGAAFLTKILKKKW